MKTRKARRKMNKKGSMLDLIVGMVIIFVIAIVILVVGKANDNLQKNLNETVSGSAVSQGAMTKLDSVVKNLNYLFVFAVAGMIIWLVVTAFFIESHPIFFIAGFLILVIAIILGVIFSNAYENLESNPQFSDIKGNYSAIDWLMLKFPTVVLVLGAIFFIIMFAKIRGAGGV